MELATVPSGKEFDLRPARGPRVFVSLHRSDCERCMAYLGAIAASLDELRAWGADLVILSGDDFANLPMIDRFALRVVLDPDGVIARGGLGVVIVDEWGEVYFASRTETDHDAISIDEIIDWVKFVAIQCPECEAPEGEWRNI